MRSDSLLQLVRNAWQADRALAPSPIRPAWADPEHLGARIGRIARLAAVLHVGRATAARRAAAAPARDAERAQP